MTVHTDRPQPHTLVVTIDRPARRNAVDRGAARALYDAFRAFDADPALRVAILTGAGGHFCAGADLKALAAGDPPVLSAEGDLGPMGPTRLQLSKPVLAAIEGYAVAGGLELACWCDLRVASEDAQLGVLCRRVGVPLIDGGTVRLPRLIGESRAMDLILTGRLVGAAEASAMGLLNRVTPPGQALAAALELARQLSVHPQACMRADRWSARAQFNVPLEEALRREFVRGVAVLDAESIPGARRFAGGEGRHGAPLEDPER